MTIHARQAREDDVQTIADLWTSAQAWLREQGEDQWQYPVRVDNINAAIANKACWLFEEAGSPPIATVTLDEFADPALWRPSDVPIDALYLHRLVVARQKAG